MQYLRLKKQSDFQKIFKKGRRVFSSSLTMLVVPYSTMRMGISIGKKHGKSVVRNRVKRLLREAFRLTADEMKGKYAIVLIPKVSEKYAFDTFKRQLLWIIKKENL